jgi:bacteriocin-like protein
MAKDDQQPKKISGEMSDEDLQSVSGGATYADYQQAVVKLKQINPRLDQKVLDQLAKGRWVACW